MLCNSTGIGDKMIERLIWVIRRVAYILTLFCLLISFFIDPYSVFQDISVFNDYDNYKLTGYIIRRASDLHPISGYQILFWLIIINVILSWLVAFNVLNTQNRFVFAVLNATHQLTDPVLNKIRKFIPNLGSIDISPVVLILLLFFIRNLFFELLAPNLF